MWFIQTMLNRVLLPLSSHCMPREWRLSHRELIMFAIFTGSLYRIQWPEGTLMASHCLSSANKVVYGLACRNMPWTIQICSFLLHVWLMFHQPWFNTCFPVYNKPAQTIAHPGTWKSLRASPLWMCHAWVKSETVFSSVLSQSKLKKLLWCAHTHRIDYSFLMYVPLILQGFLYCRLVTAFGDNPLCFAFRHNFVLTTVTDITRNLLVFLLSVQLV